MPVSGPLTDAQMRATAVPVSGTVGVTGSVGVVDGGMSVRTAHPVYGDGGAVVRQAPVDIWSVGFSQTGSSLLDPDFTQRILGTGMGVTQGNSNLVVTTGTTTNSEFLARSTRSFKGSFIQRQKTILSQRISNNNFAVMMADMIGEGLSATITATNRLTVTKAAHGFTAANVGQVMMIGAINGTGGVPQRASIASIPSVDTIEFGVTGWPASGSYTVDLFGWNYIWTQYQGSTATSANIDAQRFGWNSGNTAITINSTVSPGHVMNTYCDGKNINWSDATVASTATPNVTTRGSRIEQIPEDTTELYVYLWAYNGTSAPTNSTTWTVGFVTVEDICNVPTYIAGVRPLGNAAPLPVAVQGTAAVSLATNTPTLAAGTNLAGDVGQQYRANATGAASGTHIVSAATTNATIVKGSPGRVVGWSLANTNAAWRYVKLHNQTTTPTAGSGVVRTIAIPPNGVNTLNIEGGIAFATGIGLTTVTGAADADTAAVGLNDIVGDLYFA
jgi:hypothetical protein